MRCMKPIKKLISGVVSAVMLLSGIYAFPADAAQEQETKLIALTFDDGPNTTTTNEVLDLLEEYDAKASFFLIGVNINEESAVSVKRAYDMGCEIDNHSKTHSYMSDMSAEELQAEISYVDDYVYEITGEHTKFFRPPFIAVSDSMYDAIDLPFICGIGCEDFMDSVTAEQRAETVISSAKDGVIILMHDAAGNSQTVEALKTILPELKSQGYEFVTLTELFARQGETPKSHLLYSQVAKYPCSDYELFQKLSDDTAQENIALDKEVLKSLGDNYAIEVDYSGTDVPPVVALQKWSGDPPVWKAIQPFYSNGDKACFLASDILPALEELAMTYDDLDAIRISPYGNTIALTNAKILTKSAGETLSGDVNLDGEFNTVDIIALVKWLHHSEPLANWKAADLNHDQQLNIYDFILMKKQLL
ncbi:MAG: polysaccharide deacetylase family protein [Oscillospiraceae bacterium]|nr:polysaccharide deacetylase family protein [Oscillospiraceae bacterium]